MKIQYVKTTSGKSLKSWGIRYWVSWTSLMAQIVKNLPVTWETMFDPWVGKIPWRREWQSTPVSCPRIMDRGTWWAIVHGVAKSQTQLNNQNFLFFTTLKSVKGGSELYNRMYTYDCMLLRKVGFMPRVCLRLFYPFQCFLVFFSFFNSVEIALQLVSGFFQELCCIWL